ncbi:hypothetical protein MY11210_002196 [Beauveria gryllotalpidicola]
MPAITPYRAAASLFAIIFTGHTIGAVLGEERGGPGSDAIFASMRAISFNFYGSTRTWHCFYFAFSVIEPLFLGMSAFIAWQRGRAAEKVRPYVAASAGDSRDGAAGCWPVGKGLKIKDLKIHLPCYKEAKKLYIDTLKAIEKRVDELDKKIKTMSGNSSAITTSTYAMSARKHMAAVKKLVAMDSTLAFNLLLSMADASHTDLDATMKMCGTRCDDSIPTFMTHFCRFIEARERPESRVPGLPEVPRR